MSSISHNGFVFLFDADECCVAMVPEDYYADIHPNDPIPMKYRFF